MSYSQALPGFFQRDLHHRPSPTAGGRLCISPADLANAIAAAGPRAGLPAILLEHAFTGLRLARAGIRYLVQGAAVAEVYGRMSTQEFLSINARQAWANWRTIPRNLHGNLPVDRPLAVLDLCCGTGDSLRALAWWLPAGSQLIGMEADSRFAACAAACRYRNRADEEVPVVVHHASVLDGFLDAEGVRMADGSLDLVHAIGSIGCHFTPQQSEVVVRECARVLAEDGFALLDAGHAGTTADDLGRIAARHGLRVTRRSRSCWFDRYEQLVLRREA